MRADRINEAAENRTTASEARRASLPLEAEFDRAVLADKPCNSFVRRKWRKQLSERGF